MTFDQFLELCKSQAEKLGMKFYLYNNGHIRYGDGSYSPVGNKKGYCPVSLATGCSEDYLRPKTHAQVKLGMSRVDAHCVYLAADNTEDLLNESLIPNHEFYGNEIKNMAIDYRRRMLEAFGLANGRTADSDHEFTI